MEPSDRPPAPASRAAATQVVVLRHFCHRSRNETLTTHRWLVYLLPLLASRFYVLKWVLTRSILSTESGRIGLVSPDIIRGSSGQPRRSISCKNFGTKGDFLDEQSSREPLFRSMTLFCSSFDIGVDVLSAPNASQTSY